MKFRLPGRKYHVKRHHGKWEWRDTPAFKIRGPLIIRRLERHQPYGRVRG